MREIFHNARQIVDDLVAYTVSRLDLSMERELESDASGSFIEGQQHMVTVDKRRSNVHRREDVSQISFVEPTEAIGQESRFSELN